MLCWKQYIEFYKKFEIIISMHIQCTEFLYPESFTHSDRMWDGTKVDDSEGNQSESDHYTTVTCTV